MVSKKDVLKVLKECYDPEIPLSIVDLGLVYGVEIKDGKVKIRMTLTNPTCPLAYLIVRNVEEKISKLKGVKKVDVEIVFNPPWNPERMSKKAKKILGFG